MKITSKYSIAQIALHWLVVVLFVVNYVVSDGMGKAAFQKSQGQVVESAVAGWHVPLGIALLVLMVLRLVLRFVQGAPAHFESGKPLMDKAAQAMHLAFYVLLIAGPVTGMLTWGGGIMALGDVHSVLMNIAFYLALLHAAAAIYHQFVLKDGLLERMRPM